MLKLSPTCKYGLTFLSGLCIGGFVVHSIYDRKLAEVSKNLEDALDSLKKGLPIEAYRHLVSLEKPDQTFNVKTDDLDLLDDQDIVDAKDVPMEAYCHLVTPYSREVDPDFDAHFAERECPVEDEYVEDPNAEEQAEEPYFINQDTYLGGNYDGTSLIYYVFTHTLTLDENGIESVITDPEKFLGKDIWRKLSLLTNTSIELVWYVRNDKLETDYEINILCEKYEEDDS